MSDKTITVEYSIVPAHPIETVEFNISRPEGMSDEQWETFMKELQEEVLICML